jgi:transposase
MVYAAMDVHRKRSQIAILDDHGKEVLNRNVSNRLEELMVPLGSLEPGTPVAFEACYGWGWVVELLDELELEPHLAHPLANKAIASARLKNDKVDARTLAHLLRADLLAEAWIAPPQVRELRTLLRFRAALVRTRTASKNRIHAVFADRGIPKDEYSLATKAGRASLQALELPRIQRLVVEHSCALIDSLAEPIASLEHEIRAQATPDARVEALTNLYGVGLFTALTLVAEIGDISRFASPRKLCAWAGLTPSVRNSADKVRHGHITKQGPRSVRWVLAEAVHKAKAKPPYARPYAEIMRRRGKNIAKVAIARKLLARCYWLLKEAS